ncbi:MAG: ribosome silencing factor [Candidatus Omnitrophota bacterium]
MKAKEKAKLAAEAALSKKASCIVIMDMRAVSNITDYFVIASAPSTRRVEAIAQEVEDVLRKHGRKALHSEGKHEALWALIDYGDVIVHVFHEKTREFYDLERLWHDAPKESFS